VKSQAEWLVLPTRRREDARILKARWSESEVVFLVRLYVPHSWTFEDETETTEATQNVIVRIVLGAGVALVEVYASAQILVPVTFKESEIVSLAKRLNLGEPTVLTGDFATRDVGEVTLNGIRNGYRRMALNPKSPIVSYSSPRTIARDATTWSMCTRTVL
jgi:hypothetical protein